MADNIYAYIDGLYEYDSQLIKVLEEVIDAMKVGGSASEFITQFVAFAQVYDLDSTPTPMAIMNDAFSEVKGKVDRR